jgi:hypothetical protein
MASRRIKGLLTCSRPLSQNGISKMRHFQSRQSLSSSKTIEYIELVTTAFFEWRAFAGACHEDEELPGTRLSA